MTGTDPGVLARHGLCLIPEGRGIFPNLTVAENLWMMTNRGVVAAPRSRPAPTRRSRGSASAAPSWPGACRAASSRCWPWPAPSPPIPGVLLLDELSMGLAPLVVGQLYESVAAVAATGVTIVVVEQFVRTVLGVADRAAALVGGRIVVSGAPDAGRTAAALRLPCRRAAGRAPPRHQLLHRGPTMSTAPTATPERADRFLAELADVKHDSSSRNATLARLGGALMVVGVVLTIVGVALSQTTNNPLDQCTDVSLGLCGIALTLAGLALFLRYSLAQFLRFWLLRLVHEQSVLMAAEPKGATKPKSPPRPRRRRRPRRRPTPTTGPARPAARPARTRSSPPRSRCSPPAASAARASPTWPTPSA